MKIFIINESPFLVSVFRVTQFSFVIQRENKGVLGTSPSRVGEKHHLVHTRNRNATRILKFIRFAYLDEPKVQEVYHLWKRVREKPDMEAWQRVQKTYFARFWLFDPDQPAFRRRISQRSRIPIGWLKTIDGALWDTGVPSIGVARIRKREGQRRKYLPGGRDRRSPWSTDASKTENIDRSVDAFADARHEFLWEIGPFDHSLSHIFVGWLTERLCSNDGRPITIDVQC